MLPAFLLIFFFLKLLNDYATFLQPSVSNLKTTKYLPPIKKALFCKNLKETPVSTKWDFFLGTAAFQMICHAVRRHIFGMK